MYTAYWQLAARPFDNTADPKYYYPSESHQAALLKLRYAVENARGLAVLAGGSGLGKTLLVQTLVQQLPEKLAPRVAVVFPQMPPDQLLAFIAGELTGQHSVGQTPPLEQSVHRLQQALAQNVQAGRHAVVFVDEAQLLRSSGGLETIRLLTNFEFQNQPALTVVLSGQTALLQALERLPELDDRIGVKCLLRAFQPEETASYIAHRLRLAGAERDLFEYAALDAVHKYAQGIPRRIHRLCDLALLIGYAEERSTIDELTIDTVANELVNVA